MYIVIERSSELNSQAGDRIARIEDYQRREGEGLNRLEGYQQETGRRVSKGIGSNNRASKLIGAYRTKSVCENPYNTRYLLVL